MLGLGRLFSFSFWFLFSWHVKFPARSMCQNYVFRCFLRRMILYSIILPSKPVCFQQHLQAIFLLLTAPHRYLWTSRIYTLQESNISHLGKRKIIFKYALSGGYVNSLEGIYIIYMFIYLDQLTHFPPKQKTSWTSRACHPPYSGLVYLPSVAHHLPASPNEALSISGIGWNSKNTFSTSKRSS